MTVCGKCVGGVCACVGVQVHVHGGNQIPLERKLSNVISIQQRIPQIA